ncbi:ABC transporter permease [Endozoicomonas sp. Mp262]|uniref:ABC transporter permease n=1 Tax=Endozoicomonas sp. Mp262 TaxID=2919499 RepID=UPI0021D82414
MKPVFLWSDLLLYILLICIISFVVSLIKNPQNRERWSQVFQSRLGLSTFLIILTYIAIAVTDSVHFRKELPPVEGQPAHTVYYSNDVYSVLDILLGEIGENNEKTYSAPFSLKSYAKENRQDSQGRTYRDFPELQYAGQHLQPGQSKAADILWQSLIACLLGLVIAASLMGIHHWLIKGKYSPYPWFTGYLTLAVICCLLAWLLHMGHLYHVLGTDKAGNDVLYTCFKGIRTGILIGTLATLIMMPIAIIFGIAAGYFKGWVDDIIQYLYTTLSSIPGILLIAASVLLFQVWIDLHPEYFDTSLEKGDARFIALCFILGITSWATLCRLLRAETLKLSQLDYIQAAHAFGVSHFRILRRHILPNLIHIILITFVLDFSALVLAEAVLAYIGVGVDSSIHSWGNMISAGSAELSREPAVWWNLTGAFLFMFTLVLAANLFSDLVNNTFNPKSVTTGKPSQETR